jgi:histidine triad (HIT) family protein
MHISKYAFQLAKSPIGDLIIGLAFGRFSSILPIKRVLETDRAIAFWHPKPFWEHHILIVPKTPIRSLLDIKADNSIYLVEMYIVLAEVVKKLSWENKAYSTLINGGTRQDTGQLHMHLFKGSEVTAS